MKLSVHEIAKIINAEIIGDQSFVIQDVCSFEDSSFHDITFACEPKYLADLGQTKAGAVIVPDTFVPDPDICKEIILLKTSTPKISFFNLASIFHPQKQIKPGIHHSSTIGDCLQFGKNSLVESNVFIGSNVQINDNVHIMPGVYIGNDVFIDSNTTIKPNITIMEKTRIGKNVIIHSGTVIGSDGYGFASARQSNTHNKLIHTGYVQIGDDVEIGACNTIDRGTLGMTVIGNGVKTDNLVHIAHNVKIGDNTLLVAQVGIAGSSEIGKNVIIAGKAAVTGHIKIGDNSIVGPFTGVHKSVGENEIVSGLPHMPHKRWRKVVSIISRLPEMRKHFLSFEKRVKALENQNRSRK